MGAMTPGTLEHTVAQITLLPDQYFKLSDGTALKSLDDLKEALGKMNDDTFRQYVNDEKNDFANWIRFVYKNDSLADTLSKAKSKSAFIDTLSLGAGSGAGTAAQHA